ncbi:MAG: hypothetical protein IH914_05865 [candidate division Zixibacteria bacterium]|nr:hypothetical protein [candidate division Zixibacteria bacterium]
MGIMARENHIAKSSKTLLGLTLFSLSAVLLAYACEKPNNEVLTDEAEIVSLMENNLDAREIFDAQIFPSDSILVDSSSSELRRLFFTEKRRFPLSASVFVRPFEIENFGLIFVARAIVKDEFLGDYLQKLNGQPDLFKLWDGIIDRQALLFKSRDDNALYLGWELVGYNTGKPLALIGSDVKIRVIPASGGVPRIISNKTREVLPQNLEDFTLFTHIDALRSGDRVEIETLRQKFSVFARTAQGFRQLEPVNIAGGRYKYSFVIPEPDANRFFHLMTFQSGPEIIIDSLWEFFLETLSIVPIIPPDTTIDTTLEIDYEVLETFFRYETLFDCSVSPCLVTRVDTITETRFVDDTIVFEIDTIVDSQIVTTEPDSTFLDTSHIFDFGEIWTFPYSVR